MGSEPSTSNLIRIGTFPEETVILGIADFLGDLIILTDKGTYRIPAKTVPFLGVYPIRNWEPFLVRPSS